MDGDWLACELVYDDGRVRRFGPDERDDADIPKSITFDTQIPGGFSTATVVLPRPPDLRADDAALFSSVNFYGAGKRIAYEGRVVGIPQVGAQEIRLQLEGWVNHLADDARFRAVYRDIDLTRWGETSNARKEANIGFGYSPEVSIAPTRDDSVKPALRLTRNGAQATKSTQEVFFDSGIPGGLSAAWIDVATYIGYGASDAAMQIIAISNDTFADQLASGDFDGGPQAFNEYGTFTSPRRALAIQVRRDTAAAFGADGADYGAFFKGIAVYGARVPTVRGTDPDAGFFGSDIIANALDRAAPLLTYSLDDSIETSTFVIPHMTFLEPTTARAVVEQVTALGGAQLVPNDWGVYQYREFFWRGPGTYGRTWRVRQDQVATPISEGPRATDRLGGIMISYQDGAGATHTVGPPGSGADLESTLLVDTDPSNPATRLQRKWGHESVGITSQEGALNIGALLLADANRINWQGTIHIEGEAIDDAGNPYPPWMVRAGDRIVVEDAADTSERTISSTSYDHDALAVTANIGAEPEAGQALLANLAAATGLI